MARGQAFGVDAVEIRLDSDYCRRGDILTVGADGKVRKAGKGEQPLGVALNGVYPEGCLAVWDEERTRACDDCARHLMCPTHRSSMRPDVCGDQIGGGCLGVFDWENV